MKIIWNKVTTLSKTLALIILIAFPLIAFYLGIQYQSLVDRANMPLCQLRQNCLKIGFSPKNATYEIEGKTVVLVNGLLETEITPGSASKVITRYFGNETKGDFNGDGIPDTAFLLTQTSGGSGTFYYVAAFVSSKNGYKGTNALFLGDRIAPQTTEFRNGEIIVNYADRKNGEPLTATPSVGVSRYFKINNGALAELEK